jgi:hypothetical protein
MNNKLGLGMDSSSLDRCHRLGLGGGNHEARGGQTRQKSRPIIKIKIKYQNLNTKIKIFRRDYSKFNEPDLIDEVRGINWQHVPTDPDPSTLFEIFLNKMSSIIDKHLPIKRLSKK